MEIMNLKDFYQREENSSKDISLYLDYLEQIRDELKERENDVVLLELSESIANDIRKQIHFIDVLEEIIKNSYNDLKMYSVAHFSDEELKKIGQKYLDVELSKEKEIKEQLDAKYREKELDESSNRETFSKHGYDDSFYQAQDTELFFKERTSAHEYVKSLIASEMNRDELDKLFSLMFINNSDVYALSEMIIKLRKIVEVTSSEEYLNEIVDSFISVNSMGKLLGITSVSECIELLEELQFKEKLNTEFFASLPSNLKETMEDENFAIDGVYGSLLNIYKDYKKNGTVTMPEGSYNKSFDKSIRELESKLNEQQKKIKDLENLIADREEFLQFLQDQMGIDDSEVLSLNQIIKNKDEYDEVIDDMRPRIEKVENKIAELKKLINDIGNALENAKPEDFEILEARKSIRLMNVLGENATEEGVYSYYEAEERRLRQYNIIIDTIIELNALKEQIDAVDKSRNIIKNINGSNKNTKNRLLEEYQDVCKKCYDKLDKEGLLRIVVSRSYFDKESEVLSKPLSFEELFNGGNAPDYKLTLQNYDEFLRRVCLIKPYTFDQLTTIFKKGHVLGHRLLTAKRRSDGVFEFALDKEEYLDEILEVQDVIATIYQRLYLSRKEERRCLVEKSLMTLSKEMEHLIKNVGIQEGVISRDRLTKYKTNLEYEIDEANRELENLNVCLTANEERIEDVSMEDVKAYYELLAGFYETVKQPEEIHKQVL